MKVPKEARPPELELQEVMLTAEPFFQPLALVVSGRGLL